MSNLGPQQQNNSFAGLLQIPGGVTTQLQQVQDGEGQTTGLWVSTTGATLNTADSFTISENGVTVPNAVPRLISDGFGDYVSVKDFGATGDGSTDDTTAIQNAFTFAAANNKIAYVPAPSVVYKITATLNVSCSVIGEIPAGVGYTGQFLMTANDVAFHVYGSRLRIENLGVHFSSTGTSTVGFLFGNATTQFSRSLCKNLFVRYSYIGFKSNSSGTGTIWGNTYENCNSDLNKSYGWYFAAVNGSTTQYFNNCYAIGDSTGGNTPKGFYFSDIYEIACGQIYVDNSYDNAIEIRNCPSFNAQGMYFEGPSFSTASSNLILCAASTVYIGNIAVLGAIVNVGGGNRAAIVRPAGDANTSTRLGAFSVSGTTLTSGSFYKVAISSLTAPGQVNISDPNTAYGDIYANGWDAYITLNGRSTIPSFAYILGTWVTGDFLWNRTPTEAGTAGSKYVILGWSRLTTGSGNVLNTDWVQSRALTGN